MNSSFRPLTIKCTSIFGQANKGGAFLYEIKYRRQIRIYEDKRQTGAYLLAILDNVSLALTV